MCISIISLVVALLHQGVHHVSREHMLTRACTHTLAYTYAYVNTQAHTHTHTHTSTQSKRHTDRQEAKERARDRVSEREKARAREFEREGKRERQGDREGEREREREGGWERGRQMHHQHNIHPTFNVYHAAPPLFPHTHTRMHASKGKSAHFSMGHPSLRVEALADDLAILDDYTTNTRVREGMTLHLITLVKTWLINSRRKSGVVARASERASREGQ